VAFSCWHYLLLLKWQKNYWSHLHFQEDSNAHKKLIFEYCMNKLWIFEVSTIAFSKTWVGSTNTIVQHGLQLVYISGLLQCVFCTASLLFTYSQEWGSPGFRKITLYSMHINSQPTSFYHLLLVPAQKLAQSFHGKDGERNLAQVRYCNSLLTLEWQVDPKWVNAIFLPSKSPSLVSLFTMTHFLEVDNEGILLSNSWIWY
jgi:hypothetical protein